MPVPFFWICMGITTAAIGAIVAYEAHIRFTQFREEQEYQRYARQYAQDHPPPPPPPPKRNEFKENDSGDEDDNDIEDFKHFVRDINDNSELRRRLPRSESPNDDSYANNRPVSDQSWVDNTDYELNELERKLSEKKQYIEQQQELLNKAEMDLERRWQLHESRSSELIERMSTSSISSEHLKRDDANPPSTSSSFLSMNTPSQQQANCQSFTEINTQHSPPSYASSTNDHVISILSSTSSTGLNNSNLDESAGKTTTTNHNYSQEQLSSSVISAPPSSIQSSIIITENSVTRSTSPSSFSQHQQHHQQQQRQQQQQQQDLDSTNGLNAENPWSFDDDDDDEHALSLSFKTSMRLPNSNDRRSSSSESQHESYEWDEHSLANDVLSLSSHATNSTLADHGSNSLLSPSAPSSSVGSSYDSVHGSDLENGY